MKIKERGITLIALIITIIVLLILAGISIISLTGEEGLITETENARTETRGSSVEEAKNIWKENQKVDSYAKKVTAQKLEELLNDLESKNLITAEERKIIEETGQITIGSRTIIFIEEPIANYLKIGDYVDYQPDNVETLCDKFGETYSGYAKNNSIGQDKTLKWRVLNIKGDTVELISDKPTSDYVKFGESPRGYNARGYNNGVAILNYYCKTMYSNKSKGAIARSLNIEDIEDKMKIDENGKKAYEYLEHYKKISTLKTDKWYPLQWKNDNGIIGESEPKNPTESDIKSYATEDEAKTEEVQGDLILMNTYWSLWKDEMSECLQSADTRDNTKINSMYYELLCDNGNSRYWLASRFVIPSSTTFYLRSVDDGHVGSILLVWGDPTLDEENRVTEITPKGIRPIVSLPASVIDLNTNYETEGKWNLKF